jgi:hypothetical protein
MNETGHRSRSLEFSARAVAAALAAVSLAALGLSACGGETAGGAGSGPMGGPLGSIGQDRFSGQLESTIASFRDGSSLTTYFLRATDGGRSRLLFAAGGGPDSDLAPGDAVDVQGTRGADGGDIQVESMRSSLSASDLAAARSALVGAPTKAAKRMAFVLVDMGGTATLTQAQAVEKLFTDTTAPDTSIAEYYTEESYGIQTITGDVFGPFTYPALTTCADADTTALANALRPMVTGTYDQYGWYFLQDTVCTWGGLAQVGTPAKPAKDTWFNAESDCVVLVQEPGHNYGLTHSSSIKCGTSTLTDDLSTGCTHDEYGDPFDTMGKGCYQMNMYQKAYEGWLGGCNSVKVTASDTFDIFPMETSCNGIQVLQVPMPKVRPFTRPAAGGGNGGVTNLAYYYVEYRQLLGNFEKTPRSGNLYQGVLIHAGEDYRTPSEAGRYPYILDMTPATTTFTDADLAVGQTFTDPAGGVSITLVAADATKATVQVQITGGTGAPTCLDGTTVTAPGPQSCGAATAGTGGASGGGTGGAAGGTGGARGTGGALGAGGAPGTGGRAGGGTDAGSSVMADAGTRPLSGTGGAATPSPPGNVVGGCACEMGGPGPRDRSTGVASGLLACALAAVISRRRRRGHPRAGS